MSRRTHDLVRRVRELQDRRHTLTRLRDHAGACQALDLACSLLDAASHRELREAVLHATNPAHTPPIPVVLGPQDVAAVVGLNEVDALITAHSQAVMAYASKPTPDAGRACQRTYRELRDAVEALCKAAPTYELGGGRTA
jgi:hypothetical protein